jgi:hypothetical protein
MTEHPFTPPKHRASAFNCPFCNAFAKQHWGTGCFSSGGHSHLDHFMFCSCTHCRQITVWYDDAMIYPDSSQAPLPNPDLPEDIRSDYEEARSIINRSPRGAAALLRLCIQKLCAHLGEPGKNINQDIASLVKKGLNPRIQKSLDIVRVIGNDAVHPGAIDLRDDPDIAVHLCKLLNFIVDAMITQPKQVDSLYDALPEEKRAQIEQRDSKK